MGRLSSKRLFLCHASLRISTGFFCAKIRILRDGDESVRFVRSRHSLFLSCAVKKEKIHRPEGPSRIVLQRLDHSAIIILIVGTMTPIHQILFRGIMRWGWLILIWLIAITFLILKNIFFSSFPEWLGLILFLSLGWGGVVTVGILWYQRDISFIKPLLYGGITYTAGAILEFFQQPVLIGGVIGPHELFHIAVLIGLSFHWYFIYNIARVHQNSKEHAPF